MRVSESTAGNTMPEHVLFNHQDAILRANLYQFLAGAYLRSPSKEFVEQVLDVEFIEQIGLLLGEDVIASLQLNPPLFDDSESLATLQQEYMDLFVVPAGRYVTPFEDVYRGLRLDGKQERGPLLGERAVTVKVFYRSTGADMEKNCKELPTHIGVELSFMSYLCEQEAHASAEESENDSDTELSETNVYRLWQLKFLHEHLTDWFPQLNQAIQSNAITPFYRGLAQFTEDFLELDKARLTRQLRFDLQTTTSLESEIE